MKRLLLTGLFLISAIVIHAQGDKVATIPAPEVTLMTKQVVYSGTDNPVTISVPGFSDDKVYVSSSAGSLRKLGPGHFSLKLSKASKEVVIYVAVKLDDGRTKSAGQRTFNVCRIPHPEVTLGSLGTGRHTKEEILTATQIHCGFPEGTAFSDVKYDAIQYRLIILPVAGGEYYSGITEGTFLSEIFHYKLTTLQPGDKVIITDILHH